MGAFQTLIQTNGIVVSSGIQIVDGLLRSEWEEDATRARRGMSIAEWANNELVNPAMHFREQEGEILRPGYSVGRMPPDLLAQVVHELPL